MGGLFYSSHGRSKMVSIGGVQCHMGEISQSEQEWNARASDLNYRCRVCRAQIAFPDQQLYFAKGLCRPCLDVLNEERDNPNSKRRKWLEQIRSRDGAATLES
jgi:hypothetical protein